MSNQEKTAWLTLSLSIMALSGFVTLFFLLYDKLGTSRALMVAMSPISLIAFAAFGPLIFSNTRHGKMVMVTDAGTTIRYPYRRYLTIGIIAGLVNGAVIVTLILLKQSGLSPQLTSVLPAIAVITIAALIVSLAVLYWMKQRSSVLRTEDMSDSEVFLYGPDLDERDLAIKRTARWSGFGAFWIVYIFGIIGFWGWAQAAERQTITIDTNLLPILVFGAFLLIMLVDAMVTIILYRRGIPDDND